MEGTPERDVSLKSREVDEQKQNDSNLYPNSETFNLYSISQIPLQEDEEEDDDSDESRSGGPENAKRQRSSQTTRVASPKVIQWLQENYEPYDGSSLPRSSIYSQYHTFCSQNSLDPVNPASFGKLIRSLFPGLKTRRLGTRGNSKYHYYGIRIKETSELKGLSYPSDESEGKSKRGKRDIEPKISKYEPEAPVGASINLPEFLLPDMSLPPDVNMSIIRSFFENYRNHCQSLVDTVHKHKFSDIQQLLFRFWTQLPLVNTHTFLRIPDVIEQIIEKDHITYKAMATVLLPNVLQALPVSIPQGIRDFSRHLESWLHQALENCPPLLLQRKLMVAKKFAQSLNKQASLNHLTQAARAVLQNPSQLTQMIVDWNRLDFEFIKDQASWVCACSEQTTAPPLEEFKRLLNDRISLEQWANWLSDLVNRFIGKVSDPRELVSIAQNLLLKWSFYCSLIIRDLTIRNAPSFASFHLLRSLFDEYIFYLIETKFALLVSQQSTQHLIPSQQFNLDFQQHHPENFHVNDGRFGQMPNIADEKSIHTDEDYAMIMNSIQNMSRTINFPQKVPSLGVEDMSKLSQYVGALPERVGSPSPMPLQIRPDLMGKRPEPLKSNMMFTPQQASQLSMFQSVPSYQFDPRIHFDPMYQQMAQLASMQMQKHNGN